jgi:hypothetical protein
MTAATNWNDYFVRKLQEEIAQQEEFAICLSITLVRESPALSARFRVSYGVFVVRSRPPYALGKSASRTAANPRARTQPS